MHDDRYHGELETVNQDDGRVLRRVWFQPPNYDGPARSGRWVTIEDFKRLTGKDLNNG